MRLALGLTALLICATGAVQAQSAATPPEGKIVGQDVMGDRSRSGPDGWSWAPVDRNQAPSGKAAAEASGRGGANVSAMPAPNVGRPLPPGQDPGTPMAATPSGPGTKDSPAVQR